MGWYEKNWSPVKLKQVAYPMASASATNHTTDWFDKLIEMSRERKGKLAKYDAMDMTVDISRALDIIAEDISSDGADDNETFKMEVPEESKVAAAQFKSTEAILTVWKENTEFEYKFFDYVREALKYGLVVFEKDNKKGKLTKLVANRIVGYKLDPKNDNVVTHYIYDDHMDYKNGNGDLISTTKEKTAEKRLIKIEELLVLKIGEAPLGESILDRIYRPWKQLQLIEDAIVIYRIVRAPERRIWYIDVGSMPASKSQGYIEQIKNKMRQKTVNSNGEVSADYNPSSMLEDFYIATNSEGRGSRVETLSGGDNLGQIEDLQFFNKKLSLGLRIPPSYLDSYSEDVNGATQNDGRLGTAYISELRYVGYIKRLQKKLAKELHDHFVAFAKTEDIELHEDMRLAIEPPQSFAIYKQNELDSVTLNAYGSAEGIESLSKRFAMKRYLQLEEDEIVANEQLKLQELGLDEKSLAALPDHIKYNFVYGDGEASRNFIQAELQKAGVPVTTAPAEDTEGNFK